MSSSYLNGESWTTQFISKLLQITHSQWIFRNFSLHDKFNGYLQNEKADDVLHLIHDLLEVAPEEVPEESRFLLEINFSELTNSHIKTQTYWTLAMDAAIKATALESAHRARAKRMRRRLNTKIASKTKLGITAVEQQIRKDGMHRISRQAYAEQVNGNPLTTLDRFVHK